MGNCTCLLRVNPRGEKVTDWLQKHFSNSSKKPKADDIVTALVVQKRLKGKPRRHSSQFTHGSRSAGHLSPTNSVSPANSVSSTNSASCTSISPTDTASPTNNEYPTNSASPNKGVSPTNRASSTSNSPTDNVSPIVSASPTSRASSTSISPTDNVSPTYNVLPATSVSPTNSASSTSISPTDNLSPTYNVSPATVLFPTRSVSPTGSACSTSISPTNNVSPAYSVSATSKESGRSVSPPDIVKQREITKDDSIESQGDIDHDLPGSVHEGETRTVVPLPALNVFPADKHSSVAGSSSNTSLPTPIDLPISSPSTASSTSGADIPKYNTTSGANVPKHSSIPGADVLKYNTTSGADNLPGCTCARPVPKYHGGNNQPRIPSPLTLNTDHLGPGVKVKPLSVLDQTKPTSNPLMMRFMMRTMAREGIKPHVRAIDRIKADSGVSPDMQLVKRLAINKAVSRTTNGAAPESTNQDSISPVPDTQRPSTSRGTRPPMIQGNRNATIDMNRISPDKAVSRTTNGAALGSTNPDPISPVSDTPRPTTSRGTRATTNQDNKSPTIDILRLTTNKAVSRITNGADSISSVPDTPRPTTSRGTRTTTKKDNKSPTFDIKRLATNLAVPSISNGTAPETRNPDAISTVPDTPRPSTKSQTVDKQNRTSNQDIGPSNSGCLTVPSNSNRLLEDRPVSGSNPPSVLHVLPSNSCQDNSDILSLMRPSSVHDFRSKTSTTQTAGSAPERSRTESEHRLEQRILSRLQAAREARDASRDSNLSPSSSSGHVTWSRHLDTSRRPK